MIESKTQKRRNVVSKEKISMFVDYTGIGSKGDLGEVLGREKFVIDCKWDSGFAFQDLVEKIREEEQHDGLPIVNYPRISIYHI